MFKNIVSKSALLATALISTSAFADFNPSFYVGTELSYNKMATGDTDINDVSGNLNIKKKTPGMSLILGSRFHENVGVEVGYTFYKKLKGSFGDGKITKDIKGLGAVGEKIEASSRTKFRNIYLDTNFYLPVAEQVELIASVGYGRLTAKTDVEATNTTAKKSMSMDIKQSSGAIRFGIGAQYKVAEKVALRAMVRRQKFGKIKSSDHFDGKLFKHSTALSLGVTYDVF